MKELVGDRTKLDAYTLLSWHVTFFDFALEFIDKMWVLHQSKSMADAFSPENHSIVKIRFAWIIRAACVKQRFAGMEQKRYLEGSGSTCGPESHKFLFVVADVIRSIFCTYKIEACPRSACVQWKIHVEVLTADKIWVSFLQVNALLHLFPHHLFRN
jgi:hypothetical protein